MIELIFLTSKRQVLKRSGVVNGVNAFRNLCISELLA